MLPKLDNKNLIIVDLEALRRGKPRTSIELGRKAARTEGEEADDDGMDSLAAIIALARRKTRR